MTGPSARAAQGEATRLARVGDQCSDSGAQVSVLLADRRTTDCPAPLPTLVDHRQLSWTVGRSEEREVVAGTDGSNKLYLMRPGSLELITAHSIQDNGQAVQRLNEIEWVNGEIWANVWLTDCIVRIDPDSGAVLGWMVLTELHNRLRSTPGAAKPDVLNGEHGGWGVGGEGVGPPSGGREPVWC